MSTRVMAFFLVSIMLSSLNAVDSTKLKVKAWQSTTSEPQASDFPEASYLSSRPSTAIGFTGGGSRAYVAAIGQLAALTELGLTQNIRYIGGISGGSWATATYTYAQDVSSDIEFLGAIVDPEDLTYKGLQEMSSSCAREYASKNLTLIALNAYKEGIVKTIADGWSYGIQQTYLEPAGIKDFTYFSWDASTVLDIKSRNPTLLKSSSFLLPTNSNRAYPIFGTTLVGPVAGAPYDQYNQNYTLIEITPLYVGQFKKQEVSYNYKLGLKHTKTVGGAIEPFAVAMSGTDSPLVGLASTSSSGYLSVAQPSEVFDIRHATSLSSYAPGTFVESLPTNISEILGLSMNYWSPSDLLPSGADTFFGDGGSYENIPLISFLQRRVEKIVLFLNDVTPLQPSSKWNVAENSTYDDQISDCLSSFFGIWQLNQPDYANRTFEYEKNQVFDTADYVTVIQGLQAAQAEGDGIIATFDLTTIENTWWGIPAGITSQITFVYLGRLSGWEAKLNNELYTLLVPSENADDLSVDIDQGPFKSFPHYFTLGGEINYERANALADLTGWAVKQHSDLFTSIFSL